MSPPVNLNGTASKKKRRVIPVESMIPRETLIVACNRMRLECHHDPDEWTHHQMETVRSWCGAPYAAVPVDDLRPQCVNLRKKGLLVRLTSHGHGASKSKPLSTEYLEFMQTDQWKEYAKKVRDFWGGRCALCYAVSLPRKPLCVHHRTYDRFQSELLTDCLALCTACHRAADRARQRQQRSRGEG